MNNILVVIKCLNVKHISLVRQLQLSTKHQIVLLLEDSAINVESNTVVELKHPTLSPTIDEIIWQLPIISHQYGTRYVLYFDINEVVLDCSFSTEVLANWLNLQPVIFGTPQFPDTIISKAGLHPIHCGVIAFDLHSPLTYEVFENIRDIGRNWAEIAVLQPVSIRDKRIDVECNIAFNMVFPDINAPFTLSGWKSTSSAIPLGNVILVSGASLPHISISNESRV